MTAFVVITENIDGVCLFGTSESASNFIKDQLDMGFECEAYVDESLEYVEADD